MVLKVVLRLSWICLLLCNCVFGYPFPTNVQRRTGGGSTGGGDSVLGTYYGGGPSFYYGTGGAGYGLTRGGGSGKGSGATRNSEVAGSDSDDDHGFPLFEGFPWGHKFQVVPQVLKINELSLPEFLVNPWDKNDVSLVSVEMPPSSHIVQTSNGYQRARSVLSHSKYSPDDWDVLPVPSEDDVFQVKDQ